MSSQRGNHERTRAQKHKNRRVFKNDLHDKTPTIKLIKGIQVGDVCLRCKDIIEWKIKYKKYKPLSQPKTCTKCSQKTVRKAYHVICTECVRSLKVCAKCLEAKQVVPAVPDKQEEAKLDGEMQQLLKTLPERKRRTFLRYMNKKDKDKPKDEKPTEMDKADLMEKLNQLKMDNDEDDSDTSDSDFEDDKDKPKDEKPTEANLMDKLNQLKVNHDGSGGSDFDNDSCCYSD